MFKTVVDCDEVINVMTDLQKSKGWLYFDEAMKKAEQLIIERLPHMPVAWDRDKAIGELQQIRKARGFPGTMMNTALSSREKLKEKEKRNG